MATPSTIDIAATGASTMVGVGVGPAKPCSAAAATVRRLKGTTVSPAGSNAGASNGAPPWMVGASSDAALTGGAAAPDAASPFNWPATVSSNSRPNSWVGSLSNSSLLLPAGLASRRTSRAASDRVKSSRNP